MPNDPKPLTDEAREKLMSRARRVLAEPGYPTGFAFERWNDLACYEATVRERERRIADLEAASRQVQTLAGAVPLLCSAQYRLNRIFVVIQRALAAGGAADAA